MRIQNITSYSVESVSCKEVKTLMPFFWLSSSGLTLDEKMAMIDHLQVCAACGTKYKAAENIVRIAAEMRESGQGKTVNDGLRYRRAVLLQTMPENLNEFREKLARCDKRKMRNARMKLMRAYLQWSYAAAIFSGLAIYLWQLLSNL